MKQTTNYQLPSWDSEDRILRTDFNTLTEKVDTALAEHDLQLAQKGDCQFYYVSYTGTGERGPITFQFPKRPLFVVIQGSSSFMCAVNGNNIVYGNMINTLFLTDVTWSETSMILGNSEFSPLYCSNATDTEYHLFAVLDAKG